MHPRTWFYGLALGLLVVVVGVDLMLPALPTQAQPAATVRAGLPSLQRTPEADLSGPQNADIQATLEAGVLAVQQTAQAGLGSIQVPQIQGTVQSAIEDALGQAGGEVADLAATVQYMGTAVNQSAGSIQATVTALSATAQAAFNDLPEDLAALLQYLAEQASIQYDVETGTLHVTSYVTEAQANALLDVLIEAAEYDPEAASLDLHADGRVDVVLVDASAGLSGTAVLTYEITVVDGRLNATLIEVTVNGRGVPVDSVPDDLRSAAQLAIAGAAQQVFINLGDWTVSYTVQSAVVSEDSILLTAAIALEQP